MNRTRTCGSMVMRSRIRHVDGLGWLIGAPGSVESSLRRIGDAQLRCLTSGAAFPLLKDQHRQQHRQQQRWQTTYGTGMPNGHANTQRLAGRLRHLSSSSSGGKPNDSTSDEDGDEAEMASYPTNAPPSMPFISHIKNPIVHQLWTAREQAKDQSRQQQVSECSITKTPADSQISISYPFSTDAFVREAYRNPWGQMRFGKLLEDLDALAGNIAFQHVQDVNLQMVTASVDRITLSSPPNCEIDQHLTGKVTYVGSSSLEIRMQCSSSKPAGDADDKDDFWLEAYFTFVATDPVTKRPLKIAPIHPETELEQHYFDQGQARAVAKKVARKSKAQQGGPTPEASEVESIAQDLLQSAAPLLNMPSLADPYAILQSSTQMQNAEIAQPQVRNLANRIFGGYLMRKAFEIAFSTCYVFGGARPHFFEVGDVSFQTPVDVGDLVVFNSRVLHSYVEQDGSVVQYDQVHGHADVPLVTIVVDAWVTEPEKAHARKSNQFNFTFALPSGTQCRKVMPSNIDEARHMAERIVLDRKRH